MSEHDILAPPVQSGQRLTRVLLLEDSRFDAELLIAHLARSHPDAVVRQVMQENDFVGALREGGWDIVLSDYQLPGFDGRDALEIARHEAPEVPFVFVSGVIGEENAVELMRLGATDYVSKGRLARLPLVVDRALRERADRRARREAERQARHADAVLGRVVDALRDYGVLLLDADGRIRTWNRAAAEIFGWRAEQVVGQPVDCLFTPEDRAAGVPARELRQARASGKADDARWMCRQDGRRFFAQGLVVPLDDAAGAATGFCKILHDATPAHEQEARLRAARDEAQAANRAKDRFLAMLSHELRTPLAPIATAAHILARSATVPAAHAHLLPMIERNVALEARLIEDLLDLTALAAGKLILRPGQVDLHQVVRTVCETLDGPVRDKRLALRLQLDAPRPVVPGDEARLQQVVWNLLRNAVKFTPPDGEVRVRTWCEGGDVLLACSDSGIGIAPEALPRLFTAFEQADETVSRQYGGLGLGLAIAHGLVAEHGGHLRADSDGRDRGATFTLRLPGACAVEAGAADTAPATEAPLARGQRVLLVEDSPDAAESLRLSLQQYGYQVTHAPSVGAALRACEANPVDAVVTDIGLPDGSGADIARAVGARVPVVAVSGYGAAQDMARSREAGVARHLVKPVDPARLHHVLQALLSGR
ncbi:response regulator [Ideonella sp.]|uniref:hybrid sensor histidine kinase/response regulator n=1 Tax=Ideonella sp. TaxID=1929293 RepID=UPI0035B406F1